MAKLSHKERSAMARAKVADMVGKFETKDIVEQVSKHCSVGRAAVNDMVRSQRKREGIHRPLPKGLKYTTNFATKAKVEVNVPKVAETEDAS